MGALKVVNRVDYLRIQSRNVHVSLVRLDFVEGERQPIRWIDAAMNVRSV